MPSNHLILCRPLLLPPSIFPSIRIFPSESRVAEKQGLTSSCRLAGFRCRCSRRTPFTLPSQSSRWQQLCGGHWSLSPNSANLDSVVPNSYVPLPQVTAPCRYCSPSNPSVHGISQARILKWVAIFFSRGYSPPGIQPTTPVSPALQVGFFTTEPWGKPHILTSSAERASVVFCLPCWTPQQYRILPKLKEEEEEIEPESDQVFRSNHQFKSLSFVVICYAATNNEHRWENGIEVTDSETQWSVDEVSRISFRMMGEGG